MLRGIADRKGELLDIEDQVVGVCGDVGGGLLLLRVDDPAANVDHAPLNLPFAAGADEHQELGANRLGHLQSVVVAQGAGELLLADDEVELGPFDQREPRGVGQHGLVEIGDVRGAGLRREDCEFDRLAVQLGVGEGLGGGRTPQRLGRGAPRRCGWLRGGAACGGRVGVGCRDKVRGVVAALGLSRCAVGFRRAGRGPEMCARGFQLGEPMGTPFFLGERQRGLAVVIDGIEVDARFYQCRNQAGSGRGVGFIDGGDAKRQIGHAAHVGAVLNE